MSDNPTVTVNGEEITLVNSSDVQDVFTKEAGFEEGDQIEEWIVDTFDCELDYNNKEDCYVLRVYAYFSPLGNVNMGSISDENITVEEWERDGNMLGDDQFGIVYEKKL